MGDVLAFPRDRHADQRIDFCDPGPDTGLNKAVAGRVPPHNLDAEAQVIGAVLSAHEADELATKHSANAALAEVFAHRRAELDRVLETLRPEQFHSEANGRIWQVILALRNNGTPIDATTVAAQIQVLGWAQKIGGRDYLDTLATKIPASVHVEAHALIVVECWERRRFIATAQRMSAECYGDVGEWGAYKATARTELGRLTSPRAKLAGATIGAVVEETRSQVTEVQQGRPLGVRYGFDAIERLVGDLGRGLQHILAGRSEHGKTALAFQIACNVAGDPAVFGPKLDALGVGDAVYIESGEMKRQDLVFRGACSLARVDAIRMRLGWAEPGESENVASWLAWLAALPIIIDDQPAPPAEIARRVKAYKALFAAGKARRHDGELFPKCRLQLVIGDHLQRLAAVAPPSVQRDPFRQIAATSNGWLVDIAKGCDVATLLLSQMNRAVEDRERKSKWPRKSDLYGATEIEADADVIVAVHRPEVLSKDCSERWRGVAGILALKGRFGGLRHIAKLGFDKGRFSDELPTRALVEWASGPEESDDDG